MIKELQAIQNKDIAIEMDIEEIERILRGVFDGDIDTSNLPVKLYEEIAEYLKKGLYKGYGGNLGDFSGRDLDLLEELRTNIYVFSGAKTYSQIAEMSEYLAENKGWKEFREGAMDIFDEYNGQWLRTEYDTAIGQAQSAVKWNQIVKEKDVLPMLKYSAVLDNGTCEICEPLDGLTAPVDDPVWDSVAPMNHFNCRCLLEQSEDAPTTENREDIVDEVTTRMDDAFIMNPGKDGYVFSPDHPYFNVAPKDKDWAKENFGLPIPPKDDE